MKQSFYKSLWLLSFIFLLPFYSHSQSTTFSKTFGGFANDEGHDVAPLPDGGFLITGANGSRGDTSFDAYMLKIDAVGDTVWQHSFGGPFQDGGNEITPTPDGNFFIAGHTESFGAGDCDAYLILIDSSGDTLWTRTFGTIGDDVTYGSALSPDGNYFAVGVVDNGANGGDALIIKISPQGKILWTKKYGGPGEDYFSQIRATPDGNFWVAGTTSQYGTEDIWLMKIDTAGSKVGNNDYVYTSPDNQIAYGLWTAPDGGAMMAGTSNDSAVTTGSIILLRVGPTGEVDWSNNIINSPTCGSGGLTYSASDSSWVLCGEAYNGKHNSLDAYLMKVDDKGNTQWMKYYGGNKDDQARRLALCSNGDIIFTGFTESTGAGMKDIFVVRTSADGEVLTGISEPKTDYSFSVSPNPFSDNTSIQFTPGLKKGEIKVYDLFGRVVENIGNIQSGSIELSRNGLPAGIYFVQLTNDKEVIGTQKVVVD